MRRVLIVAYYFPPIGGIGSIRLARFAEHLPEFGWDPVVIAPRRTPHAQDPELDVPDENVVRAHSIDFGRVARTLPGPAAGRAHSNTGAGVRSMLRTAAHRYVYYPDAQIGWYPGAVAAGRRLLSERRFDAVYSSSFPITAHVIARTLARRGRIPWIAEFRDPWSDAMPVGHPQRERAAKLERAIAGDAAGLVMPTPTWADHFGRRWGREIAVIPNGYDDAVGSADAAGVQDPPVLTHLGTYYPGRQSYLSLWNALSQMEKNERGSAPRVRFIGEITPAARAELASAQIEHLVEVTGFVPHPEALRLLGSSSVLIAAGPTGTDPIDRGTVPAKLFEYVATDLPVVYAGDSQGDAAQLLLASGGSLVVEHGDVAGMTAALDAALQAGRHPRSRDGLSRRARTRELALLLDRVTS